MNKVLEYLKNFFKLQPKQYELVEGLKANNSLSNDQTNMLGNLLKLGNIQVVDIMVPNKTRKAPNKKLMLIISLKNKIPHIEPNNTCK